MAHMKRYLVPKFWPVEKKSNTFVIRPNPGPHSRDNCIPLRVVLRDVLKFAENAKEVRDILNHGKIMIDKKIRKDPKFPVGLMDVIEATDSKHYFRVTVGKKGLSIKEINENESNKKLCKIKGKTTIRGGICQINLHDGKNILVKKDVYNVGDSVLISLPDQKIVKHFILQRGENATVINGKNLGVTGKIKDIQKRTNMLEKATITLETKNNEIHTLMNYVLVGEV